MNACKELCGVCHIEKSQWLLALVIIVYKWENGGTLFPNPNLGEGCFSRLWTEILGVQTDPHPPFLPCLWPSSLEPLLLFAHVVWEVPLWEGM